MYKPKNTQQIQNEVRPVIAEYLSQGLLDNQHNLAVITETIRDSFGNSWTAENVRRVIELKRDNLLWGLVPGSEEWQRQQVAEATKAAPPLPPAPPAQRVAPAPTAPPAAPPAPAEVLNILSDGSRELPLATTDAQLPRLQATAAQIRNLIQRRTAAAKTTSKPEDHGWLPLNPSEEQLRTASSEQLRDLSRRQWESKRNGGGN